MYPGLCFIRAAASADNAASTGNSAFACAGKEHTQRFILRLIAKDEAPPNAQGPRRAFRPPAARAAQAEFTSAVSDERIVQAPHPVSCARNGQTFRCLGEGNVWPDRRLQAAAIHLRRQTQCPPYKPRIRTAYPVQNCFCTARVKAMPQATCTSAVSRARVLQALQPVPRV